MTLAALGTWPAWALRLGLQWRFSRSRPWALWAVVGRGLRRASLQMGYLKKNADGGLLYSVVNTAEPDADGGCLLGSRLFSACCSSNLCS